MKNIFKLFVPCMVVAFALSGCYDTMDDKAAVDAKNNNANAPALSLSSAEAIGFSGISASGTVSSVEGVSEVGFHISTSPDFETFTVAVADEVGTSFEAVVDEVKDNATYYVRSYAFFGNETVVGTASTVTLAQAPPFADTYLFGTYEASDIDLSTDEPDSDPYKVAIAQKNGLWNRVLISNIWGGDESITGIVDFENKTITTLPYSIVAVDPNYGDVWAWGLDVVDGKLVRNATCQTIATYDDQGNIEFGYWSAQVSAGSFGSYMTVLKKK